jgi:hypothetical protein
MKLAVQHVQYVRNIQNSLHKAEALNGDSQGYEQPGA